MIREIQVEFLGNLKFKALSFTREECSVDQRPLQKQDVDKFCCRDGEQGYGHEEGDGEEEEGDAGHGAG